MFKALLVGGEADGQMMWINKPTSFITVSIRPKMKPFFPDSIPVVDLFEEKIDYIYAGLIDTYRIYRVETITEMSCFDKICECYQKHAKDKK